MKTGPLQMRYMVSKPKALKEKSIQIRVTKAQKDALSKAATKAGFGLSSDLSGETPSFRAGRNRSHRGWWTPVSRLPLALECTA
jgi:hypothetical protein